MAIALKCENCGKEFARYASRIHCYRHHYCSISCFHISEKGSGNPHWKGGKRVGNGYIQIYKPDHPNSSLQGYVQEHVLIMENKIGRILEKGEIVHHINHNPSDNMLENLRLYSSNSKHLKTEHPQKRKRTICRVCGKTEHAKGLCKKHYDQIRWQRQKETENE